MTAADEGLLGVRAHDGHTREFSIELTLFVWGGSVINHGGKLEEEYALQLLDVGRREKRTVSRDPVTTGSQGGARRPSARCSHSMFW